MKVNASKQYPLSLSSGNLPCHPPTTPKEVTSEGGTHYFPLGKKVNSNSLKTTWHTTSSQAGFVSF